MIRIDSVPANLHLRSTRRWKRFTRKDSAKFGKLINAFQFIARNFTSSGQEKWRNIQQSIWLDKGEKWLWWCNEKMKFSKNLISTPTSELIQPQWIPYIRNCAEFEHSNNIKAMTSTDGFYAGIEIDETKYWDFPQSTDSGASEFAFSGRALARIDAIYLWTFQ